MGNRNGLAPKDRNSCPDAGAAGRRRGRGTPAVAALAVALLGCGGPPGESARDRAQASGGSAAGAAGVAGGSGSAGAAGSGSAGAAGSGDGGTSSAGGAGAAGAAGAGAAGAGAGGAGASGTGGTAGAPVVQQPTGCVGAVAAGHHVQPCAGLAFDVEVPPQCVGEACGLVLDVHGGTMSAAQQDKNTRMRELGRLHGYVVVQPNAMGGMYREGIDDGVIHEFLQDALTAYAIDRRRVHVTGFSQGGFMTWRLLCNYAELFASAAPGAAGVGGPFEGNGCAFAGTQIPKAPLAILHLQGRRDALVKYERGLAQRDAVVAGWAMGAPAVVAGDASYTRTRWENAQGAVYELIEHDYTTDAGFLGVFLGGHCYPGSTDHVPTEPGQLMGYGCKGPTSFHWGHEAMQFFLAHPKP